MTRKPASIVASSAQRHRNGHLVRQHAPFVESLEARWLLTSVQFVGGILTVTGTSERDIIGVYELDGVIFLTTGSEQSQWPDNWGVGQVQGIVVNGLGGNDDIDIEDEITKPTTLNGGSGVDNIDGCDGNDEIHGGDGNDILKGVEGVNTIYGDAGNDELWGGDDVDYLYGGGDNDSLSGDFGSDQLYGEGGIDKLEGGGDNDDLNGGDGDDILDGNSGSDILYGGEGDDHCYAQDGEVDDVNGGNQDDFDTLHSRDGNDNHGGFEVIL